MPIEKVAIVGVGLIGGSFGLALKKAGFVGEIIGVSRPTTIEAALEHGAIDRGAPIKDALGESDLIFLAQPILRILEQLPEVARLARPGSLVTDAGSTKAAIVERAAAAFQDSKARFLGGHPMAGKEGRGVAIADDDLFQGAVWALTPQPGSSTCDVESDFRRWIERIGASALELSPQEHDRVTALTSHVPQLASSALAAAVADGLGNQEHLRVAGGGLRDMTRLAGSSYEIWRGILLTNPENIREALDLYIAEIEAFRDQLTSPELAERFESAQILHKQTRNT